MMKIGRRTPAAAAGAALAAALLIGFCALRTPEPARTAFALLASVCDERSPRLRQQLLDAHVSEPLTLELEDDPHGWSQRRLSRVELLEQLAEFDLSWPRCQLKLELSQLRSASDGSEWLDGDLEFSDSQAGDLHAELRSLQARFRPVGDRYRIEQLRLGAAERRLPEARP